MPTTRFRILGTVEFSGARGWSPVAAAKQRALLAVLLLHANQVVPDDPGEVADRWAAALSDRRSQPPPAARRSPVSPSGPAACCPPGRAAAPPDPTSARTRGSSSG